MSVSPPIQVITGADKRKKNVEIRMIKRMFHQDVGIGNGSPYRKHNYSGDSKSPLNGGSSRKSRKEKVGVFSPSSHMLDDISDETPSYVDKSELISDKED